MEVTQQTTPKETVSTGAVKPVTPGATAFPKGARAGFDPRGGQTRKFSGQRNDGRFPQRSKGGFGKRDDRERKDDMDSKLLDLSRVSHTRAGGRRLRFRAIIISGNKTGKVGLGVASGLDVAQAVEKATIQSKKNMVTVPVKNGTISHEIIAKVGPAQILMKPQKKGRGLMAGGVVRLVCQLAGIKDISSKMLGTTKNKLNNARATIKAFEYLRAQAEKKGDVAKVEIPEKTKVVSEKTAA